MARICAVLVSAIAAAVAAACTSASGTPTAPVDVKAGPVAFTGEIKCGPAVRQQTSSTIVTDDGVTVTRRRQGAWQQTVTMTDPRLVGTTYHTYETDSYGPSGGAGVSISAATRRIENDGGAWIGTWFEGTGDDGQPIGDGPFVLVGEGGYRGLIAIYRITGTVPPCADEVSGFIFSDMSEPTQWTPD